MPARSSTAPARSWALSAFGTGTNAAELAQRDLRNADIRYLQDLHNLQDLPHHVVGVLEVILDRPVEQNASRASSQPALPGPVAARQASSPPWPPEPSAAQDATRAGKPWAKMA